MCYNLLCYHFLSRLKMSFSNKIMPDHIQPTLPRAFLQNGDILPWPSCSPELSPIEHDGEENLAISTAMQSVLRPEIVPALRTTSQLARWRQEGQEEDEDHVLMFGGSNVPCRRTLTREVFDCINERSVENIAMDMLYTPRTLLLLLLFVCSICFFAFLRSDCCFRTNMLMGILGLILFMSIISVLNFPNGPFIRPHPIVWRIVFGMAVLYLFGLIYCVFQCLGTVQEIVRTLFPELRIRRKVKSPIPLYYLRSRGCASYDCFQLHAPMNCWDFSWCVVKEHIKWNSIILQALGWLGKALLIRSGPVLVVANFVISSSELLLSYILNRYKLCWYDVYVLDFIISNTTGIVVGVGIFHYFKMCPYRWVAVDRIPTTTGKIKRIVLQFTPEKWDLVSYFTSRGSMYTKLLSTLALITVWNVAEISGILLRYSVEIPPGHFASLIRAVLMIALASPSIRQYYYYIFLKSCTRIGNHLWLFLAMVSAEFFLGLKFLKPIEAILIVAMILVMAGITSLMLKYVLTEKIPKLRETIECLECERTKEIIQARRDPPVGYHTQGLQIVTGRMKTLVDTFLEN
ncbi:PTDSS1 [Cordylochernes scorpioides]|uniref:Phosphatidylserine synthase n=1 Tax=Cordylochernes scorpioides TaxID=51811 RepID=A0ABY6JY51_9ARAC|nr:PTDSS1 [Cordylochernes scorpioides]